MQFKTVKELKDFLDNKVLLERFDIEGLNNYFKKFLGFEVFFWEVKDENGSLDFEVIENLKLNDDTDLYLNLYFLKDRKENIVITETAIDFDFNENNDDKFIVSVCH